jgi:hypothetical protein
MADDNVVAAISGLSSGISSVLNTFLKAKIDRDSDIAVATRKSALDTSKGKELKDYENNLHLSNLPIEEASKIRIEEAKNNLEKKAPNSFSQLAPADAVTDFYTNKLGKKPPRTPLTLAQFDSVVRANGYDMAEYFKDLGIDIAMNKDMFGEVSPDAKSRIEGKRGARKQRFSPPGIGTGTELPPPPTVGSGERQKYIQGVVGKGYSQKEAEEMADENGL